MQLLRELFDVSSPNLMLFVVGFPSLIFYFWLMFEITNRRQRDALQAANGATKKGVMRIVVMLGLVYIGWMLYLTYVTISLSGFAVLACLLPCIVIFSFWFAFRMMFRPQP